VSAGRVEQPFLGLQDLHHFEGTSEIQRMIIGRAVLGLDVR
jgi:alkylation response protein AidB-like acyl-CoA dehydrogenase